MRSKIAVTGLLALAVIGMSARSAAAQETVKIGIVIPMTGMSALDVKSPMPPSSMLLSTAIPSPARRSS